MEAASLELLPMYRDSSSSPCRLLRAGAALEKQPWLQSVAGKDTTWFWGQGHICVSAEALKDESLQSFAFLAQNELKHVTQRQALPSFRTLPSYGYLGFKVATLACLSPHL